MLEMQIHFSSRQPSLSHHKPLLFSFFSFLVIPPPLFFSFSVDFFWGGGVGGGEGLEGGFFPLSFLFLVTFSGRGGGWRGDFFPFLVTFFPF